MQYNLEKLEAFLAYLTATNDGVFYYENNIYKIYSSLSLTTDLTDLLPNYAIYGLDRIEILLPTKTIKVYHRQSVYDLIDFDIFAPKIFASCIEKIKNSLKYKIEREEISRRRGYLEARANCRFKTLFAT